MTIFKKNNNNESKFINLFEGGVSNFDTETEVIVK
jgi:hypothetical protein